jgi:hypothetical protein
LKKISLILFTLILCNTISAQVITKDKEKKSEIIDKIIEANAEVSQNEDEDLSTYFDELYHYFDHPINLNKTTVDELKTLGILNDYQINNLLTHIEKNGRLISIYEIQAVVGFDLQAIYDILPFIKVADNFDSPNITLKEMMKNGNNEIFIRNTRTLEEQTGYTSIDDSLLAASPNKRYLGSKDQLYFKYRFKYGTNVSWGLVGEKDKGEQFFNGSQQQGFDFYSAHLFLKDIGKVKQLAIGDYQVQIGQGLTFWTGRSTMFSAYTLDVKRNAKTIKPYTSAGEFGFLRGAAANVRLGDFEIMGFASRKKIDATIDDSEFLSNLVDGEAVSFSSFTVGGYHRTPSEIARKKTVGETIFGGQVAYKKRRLQLGISAVQMMWDANFQTDINTYNQFEFNNNKNLNVGVNYNYIYKNFNFFGEAARSSSGGTALVSGSFITLDPKLTLAIVYRNYSKDYHVMHRLYYGNGIGSSTRTSNEKGLYIGLEAKPVKKLTFNAYFDRYEYPWLTSSITAPSRGSQFLLQGTYKPNKKFETYVRYRQRNRAINGNSVQIVGANDGSSLNLILPSSGIDPIAAGVTKLYRWHLSYKLSDNLTLKNRVEFGSYQKENEELTNGFMMYQDIIYKPMGKKYQLTARYTMFQTDDYNTGIYIFENNVLYAYSLSKVYGRGSRAYLLLRYRIKRNIDFWVRIAQTYYTDRNTIGSGLEQIDGSTKTDLHLQLRFKF